MVTTASRSRDYLRKQGWISEVVEKKVFNIRRDLFNFADTIAFKDGEGILLVQAYLKGATKVHVGLNPIDNILIRKWITAGGKFHHHVWSKVGSRGKAKHWQVEIKRFNI